MKNILVIGGAGYIGSHTVVELLAAGYMPIILDNFNNSDQKVLTQLKNLTGKSIQFYRADYQDEVTLYNILIKHNIIGVIHFAAYKAVGESILNPLKYYQNNVAGVITLLEILQKHKISNLVFSSSAAVYGNPPSSMVTEESPCNPTSPYGWSKYMCEVIIQDACTANQIFKAISLRYFNVVGAHKSGLIGELPKGKPQNLLPILIQSITSKNPRLNVFGNDYPTKDGSCERDYIHVVDLAKAHVSALDRLISKAPFQYEVFNIGTGKSSSVLELINTFQSVNKIKVPFIISGRRPGDPASYYASVKKATKILGWQSTKTLNDAVKDAWSWTIKSQSK